jgi:hypothetical protein
MWGGGYWERAAVTHLQMLTHVYSGDYKYAEALENYGVPCEGYKLWNQTQL